MNLLNLVALRQGFLAQDRRRSNWLRSPFEDSEELLVALNWQSLICSYAVPCCTWFWLRCCTFLIPLASRNSGTLSLKTCSFVWVDRGPFSQAVGSWSKRPWTSSRRKWWKPIESMIQIVQFFRRPFSLQSLVGCSFRRSTLKVKLLKASNLPREAWIWATTKSQNHKMLTTSDLEYSGYTIRIYSLYYSLFSL